MVHHAVNSPCLCWGEASLGCWKEISSHFPFLSFWDSLLAEYWPLLLAARWEAELKAEARTTLMWPVVYLGIKKKCLTWGHFFFFLKSKGKCKIFKRVIVAGWQRLFLFPPRHQHSPFCVTSPGLGLWVSWAPGSSPPPLVPKGHLSQALCPGAQPHVPVASHPSLTCWLPCHRPLVTHWVPLFLFQMALVPEGQYSR